MRKRKIRNIPSGALLPPDLRDQYLESRYTITKNRHKAMKESIEFFEKRRQSAEKKRFSDYMKSLQIPTPNHEEALKNLKRKQSAIAFENAKKYASKHCGNNKKENKLSYKRTVK